MTSFSLLKPYFARYNWYFGVGLAALFLVDGLQIVIPWLVKQAIDRLTTDASDHQAILRFGIYIILLSVGVGITRFCWRYFIIGISRRIEEDLRNRFYRHLQTLSFSYYDRTPVGDLMAHAINDLEAVRMMCGMALVAGTDAALLMVASLAMMLSINIPLTLFVLIPLPIVTTTVLRLGPKLHHRFREVQSDFSRLSQKAQETFAGIRVIKSFVQESAESTDFSHLNQNYLNSNMKLVRVWGVMHPIIWTISGACSVIILLIGGDRVMQGAMSMGDFVAFNSYLGILVWPMIAVGWVVNMYQRGKASLGRIFKVFEIQPDVTDAPESVDQQIQGRIEFKNLTFAYKDSAPVLKNIQFTIEPGQWVTIMGHTGSGKTSIVNLISRVYEVPDNAIFIDGRDIRSFRLESLRSQIGVVPQQSFLFSDSILNNIRFGKEMTVEQVEEIAKIAQVYKDVDLFPNRFDTLIGERGVTLSGGQKQRTALARAIAANPRILILDDSFSAVDTETEADIIRALKEFVNGKTVILISHRVSSASQTDKIIFLEDGVIIEQGSHHDLIKQAGRYFAVYEQQRLIEEMDRQAESTNNGYHEETL